VDGTALYPSRHSMRERLRDLYRARHLLYYLTASKIRSENADLSFGSAWFFINPLFLVLMYSFFMIVVMNRPQPNFALFVLVVMIPWQSFSLATRSAMSLTRSANREMRQVAFPRAVLPLAASLAEGVRLFIAMAIYVVIAIPFGIVPSAVVLWGIPFLVVVVLFSLSTSLIFALVHQFVPDIAPLSIYLFRLWFFLSPGIYPVTYVPERFRHWYSLNPIVPLFTGLRNSLFYHQSPNLVMLGILLGGGIAAVPLSLLLFTRYEAAMIRAG
jgi:homopolymeric O-antigen transport system permease protein